MELWYKKKQAIGREDNACSLAFFVVIGWVAAMLDQQGIEGHWDLISLCACQFMPGKSAQMGTSRTHAYPA